MERKLYRALMEWKENHDCVLFVRGPRQTGKTYLIKEFSKEYENSLYINLEDEPELKELFERSRNPDELFLALSIERGFSVNKGDKKPLLIIDEIQSSDDAFSALKPLAYDGRCDVVASGSLLGALMNSKLLSPAGYIKYLDLHPMDFEEFLWAFGTDKDSTQKIKAMVSAEDMPDAIRKPLEEMYRKYILVGGMPAAVKTFVESKDYSKVWEIHSSIVEFARKDIIKYAPNSHKLRILACFDSIPRILAKENKTFTYSDIEGRRGYGSREYDPALDWLIAAGLVTKCNNLRDVCEPLNQNEREGSFKVYMFDQGILTHMFGMETARSIAQGDVSVKRGALMESSTAQALISNGFSIHFYSKKDSTLEIDFIISYENKLTAIEVKSGASKRSKSLKTLMSGNHNVEKGIKLADCKVEIDENGMHHLPLFAPSFFERPKHAIVDIPDIDALNKMLSEDNH